MSPLTKLRDAVDAMVRVLVGDPDSVVVELESEETTAVLHVVTSTRDLGKIIGRRGRTIGALRLLVQAASQNMGKTVALEISSNGAETTPALLQN